MKNFKKDPYLLYVLKEKKSLLWLPLHLKFILMSIVIFLAVKLRHLRLEINRKNFALSVVHLNW